jgi:uncharacterized membrane protein
VDLASFRDHPDERGWQAEQAADWTEHDGLYRRHAADRGGLDAAGVAVIVIGAVISTGAAAVRLAHHETATYRRFRQQLGQTILLGLELLVAGDIIRTVATQPTFSSVGILAIIVLIRTFLSFSLEVELTGRWPWQSRTPGATRNNQGRTDAQT